MSKLYGDVTGKSGWPPIPKKPKSGEMNDNLQGFLDTVKEVGGELASRDKKIEDLKLLITELCDALEEEYGSVRGDGHMSNLLIRAREATRG